MRKRANNLLQLHSHPSKTTFINAHCPNALRHCSA